MIIICIIIPTMSEIIAKTAEYCNLSKKLPLRLFARR